MNRLLPFVFILFDFVKFMNPIDDRKCYLEEFMNLLLENHQPSQT